MRMSSNAPAKVGRILVLDIGGGHVKFAFSDSEREREVRSGPKMDPGEMMRKLAPCLQGERFDRVSIGYPGLVVRGRIVAEPHNLGKGWMGFDFEREFRRPVKVVNDAVMQALGCYHGGRMLYLGLGTGLGAALIIDGAIEPMEIAHLPYKKGKTYEDYVGRAALDRDGRKKWQKEVLAVSKLLSDALEPDYVVLGGGNAAKVKQLPPHTERGGNQYAVRGGERLWNPDLTSAGVGPVALARPPLAHGEPGRGRAV